MIVSLIQNIQINTSYDTVTDPDKLGTTNYTWSSMGPTMDGDAGVSIIAPGGAITCVPNWTRAKNQVIFTNYCFFIFHLYYLSITYRYLKLLLVVIFQLMNGTSMSAPNATGCFALLVSAAKATNIPRERVNPYVMRRIVENSAMTLPNVEPLGQGHGLIQVVDAWRSIEALRGLSGDGDFVDPWFDVSFEIKVLSSRFSRGVHLRQPVEANTATTYKVDIKPLFFNQDQVPPERLIEFEMRLRLESTVDWIRCPETLQMHKNGKTIAIAVDPRNLPLGTNCSGYVYGYDERFPDKGAVFEVPVTVIRPTIVADHTIGLSLQVPIKILTNQFCSYHL